MGGPKSFLSMIDSIESNKVIATLLIHLTPKLHHVIGITGEAMKGNNAWPFSFDLISTDSRKSSFVL